MKTIARNFLSVLRRFKMATILNVLGLSIAFVAFMLIMIQVNYDLGFDSCQKNACSIFRLDIEQGGSAKAIVCRPFARAFTESSPHIKEGCVMAAWSNNFLLYVEQNGKQVNYDEDVWSVSPEIMQVFHFDMLEGDAQSLDEPNSVIIPESTARRLFGNKSAINKQLHVYIPQMAPMTVKGVYKDFPRNSSLKNSMYASMNPKESYDDWENWGYLFFLRLDDPANKESVLDNFRKNFNAKEILESGLFGEDKDAIVYHLTSLPALHFLTNVDFDTMPKASRQTIFVLFSIAFIILIIAGINFTNFSRIGHRMRNMLIGFQLAVSLVLIAGALIVHLQNYYMRHAPLGYDKNETVVAHLNVKINRNREAFTNRLKAFADVKDVTYSQFLLSSQKQYMGYGRDYNGKPITFQCIPVSSSFLKVMGIEVTEGRDFRPEDDQKETGCYLFNEKARAEYGLKLNEKIEGAEIIGFIPDIKFASFRQEVAPMAFYVWGKYQWGQEGHFYDVAYVKFKAGSDLHAGMKHVRESLAGFDNESSFDVRSYDEVLQQTYKQESNFDSLITLSGFAAIFILIAGVFGRRLEGRRK
ncbi:ABC transporter permease [Parabacteroides acidifaciens]|uniref:ABC transporter permease n=1 Tax=Parabacteroides acidifaciens TaxID=2290935 RepID=A0A3D8HIF2_9BACT|nr:ABC transporter permease [Parabacteroides acidifaciens]MBC8600701.1 ABC transporter permease [Parabacteroides acidifaciens]RDU50698.1 ABC transporter permease [Parabacteroides acidifaciens]